MKSHQFAVFWDYSNHNYKFNYTSYLNGIISVDQFASIVELVRVIRDVGLRRLPERTHGGRLESLAQLYALLAVIKRQEQYEGEGFFD